MAIQRHWPPAGRLPAFGVFSGGVRLRSDEEPLIKRDGPTNHLQTDHWAALETCPTASTGSGSRFCRPALDDAGSNKQVLAAEFRVTHALGVFLETTRPQFGSSPTHFGIGFIDRPETGH